MESYFKVSVIIPMYNVQEYIEVCIESILKQSLKNIEILCIDDGSTDCTVAIIKVLQKKCKNLRLVTQEHGGPGAARNLGIKNAKGKYLSFLDADDTYYDENALEVMVRACEENQMSLCGSYRKIWCNNELKDSLLLKEFDIPPVSGRKMNIKEFQEDYHYQSFIFEKKLLVDNDILFPDYLRYQDPPFFLNALVVADEFWVMPVYLYCYRFGHQDKKVISSKIQYILRGIKDNLQTAIENDYERLYSKIIMRLNRDYCEMIVESKEEIVHQLMLEVSEINSTYLKAIPLDALIIGKIKQLQIDNSELREYFLKNRIRRVVVYGVGKYGKILIQILEECGLDIICCVDRSVREYKNYQILFPEEEIPKCDMMIVSLLQGEDIKKNYEHMEETPVVTFRQIVEEINSNV